MTERQTRRRRIGGDCVWTHCWSSVVIFQGSGYQTLEQRASEWTVTAHLCELPIVLLHEIASFVPFAGARFMVTCRGGLSVFFGFERWLRSLAGQTRNIYERAMFALMRCLYDHDCDHDLDFLTFATPLRLALTLTCFLHCYRSL